MLKSIKNLFIWKYSVYNNNLYYCEVILGANTVN